MESIYLLLLSIEASAVTTTAGQNRRSTGPMRKTLGQF